MNKNAFVPKRFFVYMAQIPQQSMDTHVLYGYRPVIVVSNTDCNMNSKIITVVPCSTKVKNLPTHIQIHGLNKQTYAYCEGITSIDVDCLKKEICCLTYEEARAIFNGIYIQLGVKKA